MENTDRVENERHARDRYGIGSILRHFEHDKTRHVHYVFCGPNAPPQDVGFVGDVYELTAVTGNLFYIRTQNGWTLVIPGDHAPHPTIGSKRVFDIVTRTWVNRSTIRVRKMKLARKRDADREDAGVSGPSAQLSKRPRNRPEGSPLSRSTSHSDLGAPASLLETAIPRTSNVQPTITPYTSENEWLVPLINEWMRTPLSRMPTATLGMEVLQELLHMKLPIVIHEKMDVVDYVIKPTLQTVIKDLVSLGDSQLVDYVDYRNFGSCKPSVADILASLIESPHVARWDANNAKRCLGALSIPGSRAGMSNCALTLKDGITRDAVVAMQGSPKSTKLNWMSTLSPLGAVTHPHLDFHGATQVFLHISGQKLWLMWPPTPHNLVWYYNRRDRMPTTNWTLDGIRELEKMTAIFVSDEQVAFALPPYGLHAVLSFTPASHTCVCIWSYRSFDATMLGLDQDLEWGSNPEKYGFSVSEGLAHLREIEQETVHWERLLRRYPSHPRYEEVGRKMSEVKKRIDDLVRRLSKRVPRAGKVARV